jgi:deoxyribodipyrimidine photolyase-related protein
MINNGLLNCRYVFEQLMKVKKKVPINSWEGYVRQLIGWREYMIMLYWKNTPYK